MRERLLTSHVFSVDRCTYDSDDGNPVVRDVVVHPGAVVLLPEFDADTIIMIRNYRYSVEDRLWELPAGTREKGESALETASRELQEETGFQARTIEPLTEFFTSPGICTERMHAYIARGLTEVGQSLQDGERIEVERVAVNDARRMILSGEIRDGKTIAVLGYYFLLRNEETPTQP